MTVKTSSAIAYEQWEKAKYAAIEAATKYAKSGKPEDRQAWQTAADQEHSARTNYALAKYLADQRLALSE